MKRSAFAARLVALTLAAACDRDVPQASAPPPPVRPAYNAEEVADMLDRYYRERGVRVCCVACQGIPICAAAVETSCGSCNAMTGDRP